MVLQNVNAGIFNIDIGKVILEETVEQERKFVFIIKFKCILQFVLIFSICDLPVFIITFFKSNMISFGIEL